MKNNKFHKILGDITAPGLEGRESYTYAELAGMVGMPEMEIKGLLDDLEKHDHTLFDQRPHEGYISRNYEKCRKAYMSGRYKEPEVHIIKPNLFQRVWKWIVDFSGALASLATVGSFVLGYIAYQQSKTVESLSIKVVSLQQKVLRIDSTIQSLPKSDTTKAKP